MLGPNILETDTAHMFKATSLLPVELKALNVPGILNSVESHPDCVSNNTSHNSADLDMKLVDISRPGQYKFSGFGLNITTVVFLADAQGEVGDTSAGAYNRMEVVLVRD